MKRKCTHLKKIINWFHILKDLPLFSEESPVAPIAAEAEPATEEAPAEQEAPVAEAPKAKAKKAPAKKA
jgi:hypothetical protein